MQSISRASWTAVVAAFVVSQAARACPLWRSLRLVVTGRRCSSCSMALVPPRTNGCRSQRRSNGRSPAGLFFHRARVRPSHQPGRSGAVPGGLWSCADISRQVVHCRTSGMRDHRSRARGRCHCGTAEESLPNPGWSFGAGWVSQGAMVASEVAWRSSVPLTGLVLLSGTPVDEQVWRSAYGRRRGYQYLSRMGGRIPCCHSRVGPNPRETRGGRQSGDLAPFRRRSRDPCRSGDRPQPVPS